MAIKVIVELQAKPGRRAELKGLLESIVAKQGPGQRGFLGSTRYEVLDNPTCWLRLPIGSQPRRGWRTCRRRRPPAPTHLCWRCWRHHSGPQSSGNCPDGRAVSPSATRAPPRGERRLTRACKTGGTQDAQLHLHYLRAPVRRD